MPSLSKFNLFIILGIMCSLFVISGCSTKMSSVQGDYENTKVVLTNSSNGDSYYLSSMNEGVLASSKSDRGVIIFDMPAAYGVNKETANSCLFVIDDDQNVVSFKSVEGNSFKQNYWAEYVSYNNLVKVDERNIRDIENRISQYKSSVSTSRSWLNRNPKIYRSRRCITPRHAVYPKGACRPGERSEKATALCAASAGGCGIVSSAIGDELNSPTSRFLSSQACSAAVSGLKGDKYTLDDALGTFTLDLFDNAADNLLKSDSFFGNLLGVITKTGVIAKQVQNFNSCVNKATHSCTRIYQKWEREPRRLKNECERSLSAVLKGENGIETSGKELVVARKQLEISQAHLSDARSSGGGSLIKPCSIEYTDIVRNQILPLPVTTGQKWSGSYVCGQRKAKLDLKLSKVKKDESVEGVFTFSYGNSSPTGGFYLSGTYDRKSRKLKLNPGRWIKRPFMYQTVGMEGTVSEDGDEYEGEIKANGCEKFSLELDREA